MKKTVYLAIWHDRHTDDKFVAFDTPEDAVARCREWISTYPDRYNFEEKNYGYIFWADAGDDYRVNVQQISYITNGRKKGK